MLWPLKDSISGSIINGMNTATKMLEAMRRNPRDWRIEQLHTVARQYGITVRSDGGSHQVFSHSAVAEVACVPAHRPIKPIYIRQFLALVDSVKEACHD